MNKILSRSEQYQRFLLTLVAVFCSISAIWADSTFSGGDGSEGNPYQIKTTADLNQLATDVNNGNNYSGKFFKLMNDIYYKPTTAWNDESSDETNYTAIGPSTESNDYFGGTIDGDNHIVSGIRIYFNDSKNHQFQGLFGCNKGTIKNVILDDARITGGNGSGGIAGGNNGGTIENCHVLGNVTIHTNNTSIEGHGGVVGINNGNGTVKNCTSAVKLTIGSGASGACYGGVVGLIESGNIANNLAIGVTVPKTNTYDNKNTNGAIVGFVYKDDETYVTLKENYYCFSNVAGYTSGIGCGGADINDNNGAKPTSCEDITLSNADNEVTNLSKITEGNKANIKLNGRTFYKDGNWNTLCLPFNVSNFIGTPLTGATVKELSSASFSNGTLTLNFSDDLTTIVAGKPYIVKWTSSADVADPIFAGVTISKSYNNTTIENVISFKGTYGYESFTAENRNILFMGDSNTLYFPQPKTDSQNSDITYNPSIGAFCAYFKLADGITAGDLPDGIRSINLNFGDGEGTTSIEAQPILNSHSSIFNEEAWYTLDGRRLASKPTQNGLYINGGRKVAITRNHN